jgi:hypothetical protein
MKHEISKHNMKLVSCTGLSPANNCRLGPLTDMQGHTTFAGYRNSLRVQLQLTEIALEKGTH